MDKDILVFGIIQDMVEQTDLEKQMIRSQKLETMGTLVGELAHDINNLITGIMGCGEILRMRLAGQQLENRESVDQALGIIQTASQRATDIARQLLTLARKNTLDLVPVHLQEVIGTVALICSNSFPKTVSLSIAPCERDPVILAEPARIEQALLNLCLNAMHAVTSMRHADEQQGGTIEIKLSTLTADPYFCSRYPEAHADQVYHCVKVQDNGVGIKAELLDHIFEPFFTTRSKTGGSGLGLALLYTIVKQYNGFFDVCSTQGVGTTFTVFFPDLPEGETASGTIPVPDAKR